MKTMLAPPWVIWANEVKALFAQDKEVKVVLDWEEMAVRLYVESPEKADALTALLPETKDFGGVSVSVSIIPGNKPGDKFRDPFKTAFAGNDLYVETVSAECPLGSFTYVVWRAEILQFFADNLGDVCGNKSMLVETAVKDVLKDQHSIYHCTEPLAIQLPQWP